MFRIFVSRLPQHFFASLTWRFIQWHLVAIALTYFLVMSGFDWFYFEFTRDQTLQEIALPSAIIGFFIPIVVPVGLYILAEIHKNKNLESASAALAQAGAIAWLVSSIYKVFTGRLQPEFLTFTTSSDYSHMFQFGFFRHGIFWGWPSSHTAVAFAMSVCFIVLYPNQKIRRVIAIVYMFYIGFGISITIHWFSDFIAGAIIGSAIGLSVAKSYLKEMTMRK